MVGTVKYALFALILQIGAMTATAHPAVQRGQYNVEVVTTDYHCRVTDQRVFVNGASNIYLPSPTVTADQIPTWDTDITVKDISGAASTTPITVSDPGGLLIDGQATYVLNQNFAWASFRFDRDGSGAWYIFHAGSSSGSPSIWNPVISLNGRLPNAGEVLARVPLSYTASLPASLTGSVGDCFTAFTSNGVFTLLKNGSSIGTATIPAATTGRNVATFSFASVVNFAADDEFSFQAPSSQDATGENFAFSFLGAR